MGGSPEHPVAVTMDRSDKGWLLKLIIGVAVTQTCVFSLSAILWGWKMETRVTVLEKSSAQAETVIREELRPVVNSMNQLIGEVRARK
jgi:hypothetical protein